MKTLIIAAMVILVFLLAWYVYQQRISSSNIVDITRNNEHYFESTHTESRARANSLLPEKGSEDVSHLLILSAGSAIPVVHKTEYLPTEAVQWAVTVNFSTPVRLAVEDIKKRFTSDWRSQYGGVTLFGMDSDTGKWTYVIAGDGPTAVSSLKLAWDYSAHWDEQDNAPASAKKFQLRLVAVKAALQSFGEFTLVPSLSPELAAKRADELKALQQQYEQDAIIVLRAAEGKRYDGRQIWDVMLSLGLEWGDMDIFHWHVDEGFSVWTTTDPGYFFPEAIAQGQVQTHDLVLGFPIARRNKPVHVFEQMLKAADYAQKRLGGELLDKTGKPLDRNAVRREINQVAKELTQAGFTPGSTPALMLF